MTFSAIEAYNASCQLRFHTRKKFCKTVLGAPFNQATGSWMKVIWLTCFATQGSLIMTCLSGKPRTLRLWRSCLWMKLLPDTPPLVVTNTETTLKMSDSLRTNYKLPYNHNLLITHTESRLSSPHKSSIESPLQTTAYPWIVS
jgi:hypothetical protein